MTTRMKFGAGVTAAWLGFVAWLLMSDRATWPRMHLNEWGDFFAGVVAPLAFLWLILGYVQQGEEVPSNTQTIQLQQQALPAAGRRNRRSGSPL